MNTPLKFINEQVNQGNNSVNVNNKAGATINIHYHQMTLKAKKILLIVFAIFFLIAALATPVIINSKRDSEDRKIQERITSIFNSALASGDFLSGAMQYHELAFTAKNHDTYLLVKSMEAFAYSVYIKSTSDKHDIFINSALSAVNDIKRNTDNTSLFYYLAYAVESDCYDVLNLPIDDKKWVKAISELEEFAENNSPDLLDDFSPLVFEAVYSTLSEYFRKVASLKFLSGTSDEAATKATKYKQLYATFFQDFMEISVERPGVIGDKAQIESYEAELNTMIFSSSVSLEELNRIIDNCRSKLKEIDYSPKNESTYIAFNRLIAKGVACKYLIYRHIGDSEGMNHCSQGCHNIVAGLLRLSKIIDENSIFQIFFACKYMFIAEEFTKDDAIYYYENTLKFLSIDEYKNFSLNDKEGTLSLICDHCKAILDKYGYIEKIYELGLSSAKELYAYSNVLGEQSDENDMAELYYSYFTEYEKP